MSIFLGKNYPINERLSTGWILNYTRLDANYKDNYGNRKDNIFQGSTYLNYYKDNTNLFGTFYAGYDKGDLNRDVNLSYLKYNEDFTDVNKAYLNESLNSNLKSYYIGFLGKISKKYSFESFYIEPISKIQLSGIFQKSINENGGTYNMSLDKINGMLNSGYIGSNFGNEWSIGKYSINLELNLGIKQQLNKINKNINFEIDSLGNEVGSIEIKNKNRLSEEVGITIEFGNIWNGLSIYGEYKRIYSENNSWKAGGGLNYRF